MSPALLTTSSSYHLFSFTSTSFTSPIASMFELYPTVPSEVKRFRSAVTRKYGRLTISLAFGFIVAVCLFQVLKPIVTPRKLADRRISRRLYDTPKRRRWSVGNTLMVLSWTCVLFYLIFRDTQNDYTFLVKRLGRLAVALMPPTYFLILRPSPLPRVLYLSLLPFHKWLSRVIVLISACHGILYTWIYYKTGKLRKLTLWMNINGIIALACFLALGLTSVRYVRRRAYKRFFAIHYILAWACVGLVFHHSNPPSNDYMAMCAILLIGQVVYRVWASTHMTLPVQFISSNLLLISIPKEKLPKRLWNFAPGSHIRLSMPLHRFSTWLESSHPYTVASLPEEDHLKLVVRKTKFSVKLRQSYALFGPFDSLPPLFLQDARKHQMKRVLFVIGGSGIAFGAPVMRFLKQCGIQVKMLWAIRDVRDIRALDDLKLAKSLKRGEIEVYITKAPTNQLRRKSSFASGAIENQVFGTPVDDIDESLGVTVDNLHCSIPEQRSLLSGVDFSKNYQSLDDTSYSSPAIFNHRLVLNMRLKSWLYGIEASETECCCLDQLMDTTSRDRQGAWVITSGAELLVNETKQWAQENGFEFFQEEFTL